jgi:pilus assembly protein CpaC
MTPLPRRSLRLAFCLLPLALSAQAQDHATSPAPASPIVQAGPNLAQAGGIAPRPGLAPGSQPAPATVQRAPLPVSLTLEAGGGRLVQLPSPALTVMAADPRIARVQPASPTSLFVMAVAAGRTTIIATSEDGTPVAEYDVVVQPGRGSLAPQQTPGAEAAPAAPPPLSASAIESLIRRMVRGAQAVRVTAAGPNGLLLSGQVPAAAEAQRAEAIARAYAGDTREVINDLALLSSIQVNVRVRVAEISRQVTRELGFNWQALASDGSNWLLGVRTGAGGRVADAITSAISATASAVPGRYGLSYSSSRFDINAVVDALAADQLITILAEPNLTAQSGEVASFLAGGEFPVPVAASSATNAISIEFKQFGVSLAFVPTVLGPDRLNLRVRPEVSELSENGAISLPLAGGVVTIPALNVRRAETTVELGSGQSFAIAGLLQRSSFTVNSGVAGLADVPVLGALFRSDRFRRNETELVIIVTPYLVRPVSDPRALAAPTDSFRPATDLDRILNRRQIARGAPAPQIRTRLDAGFILE